MTILQRLVRDVLDDGITLQALGAALATIAAVLDATERRLCDGGDEVVDREVADLDALGEMFGVAGRAREGIGRKSVGKGVGLLDRLVQRLDRIDQRERAERLLVHGA